MKENSINKKEVDNGKKINIPIISNQEIENTINTKNLYDKIAEQIYHDRKMIILQEFIKKLQKENEKLNNRCRNLDKEAQAYLEELAGDNTLTRRTIKQLQEENEELNEKILDNAGIYQLGFKDGEESYIKKIKDKIEEEKLPLIIVGGRRNKKTLEYGIQLGRRQILQELLESEENKC